MKALLRLSAVIVLLAMSCGLANASGPPVAGIGPMLVLGRSGSPKPGTLRRFTVEDSASISTFVNPSPRSVGQASRVAFSPDGRSFVAATMRGDPGSGRRETILWSFDVSDARHMAGHRQKGSASIAKPLARFASGSNRDPLSDWRWSTDSASLFFLGASEEGVRRLYRVAAGGGEPRALSPADQDVSRYDEANGVIVYLAHPPVQENELYQAGGPSLPDTEAGTGKSLLPLLFPKWLDSTFDTSDDELWTIEKGEARPVIDPADGRPIRLKKSKLSLSPDGRRLIASRYVATIPPAWERYQPLIRGAGFRIVADTPQTRGSTGIYRPQSYAIVDLATGSHSALVDAPIEFYAQVSNIVPEWSDDGARIALPGTYPAISSSLAPKAGPILPCEILVHEIASGETTCVRASSPADPGRGFGDREQIVALSWARAGRELIVEYAAPNSPAERRAYGFEQREGAWTRIAKASARDDALTVSVAEALDRRPVLMARLGRRDARPLLDPNPQLDGIALGKAELYHWRDQDGDGWSGALVTPPDFIRGRRYPLVIQTHNLDRARFLVDGPSATGFAARALAARDMVVLQVDEIPKHHGSYRESPSAAAGYRAAIAKLADEGIIDPGRVGIIGWSHMGPYVLQGLIDDQRTYAAATLAESSYTSLGEYLMNIDYMGPERERMFREQMGAKPFGDGLRLWLERSPGFHTDRICAPVLFQFNSPAALVYGWDLYAALRAQDKPVDLLYLRGGQHILAKTDQRIIEQGMNVDWYDFWLNGRKQPGPAKAEMYARWERMAPLGDCPNHQR